MAERRPLIDGLKSPPPPIDPREAKEFIYGSKPKPPIEVASPQQATPVVNRTPISTKLRADFAAGLKKASLERQLNGIEPSTLQDILEEAIEPWLKKNGYLA